jgi:hypothetical protein
VSHRQSSRRYGGGNFTVTLDTQFFPYAAPSASGLTIDALTLYAQLAATASAPQTLASVTPAVNLGALSRGLAGTGQASSPCRATIP